MNYISMLFTVAGLLNAEAKTTANFINDSWYTMQAGNTPYGYFHETIELKDQKYNYRYALKKFEGTNIYEENIGALAKEDLTPIALNLNKSGGNTLESTNITYSPSSGGGIFHIEMTGSTATKFDRHVNKDIILDVFFPIWITKNWDKLKPNYRGWVKTFGEDPTAYDSPFKSQTTRFQVVQMNTQKRCLEINVETESLTSKWCLDQKGILQELSTGRFRVKRVSGEAEAKSFVSGLERKKTKE